MVVRYHFSQVQQTIAHTAQRSIDADFGNICNFFKAKVAVHAQYNHLALLFGQCFNQLPYALVCLPLFYFVNWRIGAG